MGVREEEEIGIHSGLGSQLVHSSNLLAFVCFVAMVGDIGPPAVHRIWPKVSDTENLNNAPHGESEVIEAQMSRLRSRLKKCLGDLQRHLMMKISWPCLVQRRYFRFEIYSACIRLPKACIGTGGTHTLR